MSGQIKANIPCRIAFSVPSKYDSMVILDRSGAECLIGSGDMLFIDGKKNKSAQRLQCGYLEDTEINNVVIPLIKDNQPKDYAKINWNNVNLSESEKIRFM